MDLIDKIISSAVKKPGIFLVYNNMYFSTYISSARKFIGIKVTDEMNNTIFDDYTAYTTNSLEAFEDLIIRLKALLEKIILITEKEGD